MKAKATTPVTRGNVILKLVRVLKSQIGGLVGLLRAAKLSYEITKANRQSYEERGYRSSTDRKSDPA
jgi:hypothetical protein